MDSMMRFINQQFCFSFYDNVSERLKAMSMTLKSVFIQGRMWNTVFHQIDCNIISNMSNQDFSNEPRHLADTRCFYAQNIQIIKLKNWFRFGTSSWLKELLASLELFRRWYGNFFLIQEWRYFKTWFIAFFYKRKNDFLFRRLRRQWIWISFYLDFYPNLLC